jgi:hypothetical protein
VQLTGARDADLAQVAVQRAEIEAFEWGHRICLPLPR